MKLRIIKGCLDCKGMVGKTLNRLELQIKTFELATHTKRPVTSTLHLEQYILFIYLFIYFFEKLCMFVKLELRPVKLLNAIGCDVKRSSTQATVYCSWPMATPFFP